MPALPPIYVNLFGIPFAPRRFHEMPELARRLEASGLFGGISIGERTVSPPKVTGSPGPDHSLIPFTEPVATLAAVAGVTTELGLMCAVLGVPVRPAVLLAKELATLDHLAQGRFVLGASVSHVPEEYDAVGLSFDDRYRLLDDTIGACRQLWSSAPASFEGDLVHFGPLSANPLPWTPGGPPVWFASHFSADLVRRVVELGDGWMPWPVGYDQMAGDIHSLRKAMADAGRDPESLGVLGVLPALDAESHPVHAGAPGEGPPDLAAMLGQAPAIAATGVSVLGLGMNFFSTDLDSIDADLEHLGNLLANLPAG